MAFLLSVIVPIYNIEEYLERAIESLLSQTIQDLEIILVDDGSKDSSREICEKYKHIEYVKVVHKSNGGLVSARKAGLEVASGRYIGFLDGDDWVDNDYYATMMKYAEQYDCDIVCSGYSKDYGEAGFGEPCRNRIESGLYSNNGLDIIKDRILYSGEYYAYGIIPTVWSKVFKQEVLKNWLNRVPNSITIGEDVACSMPCLYTSRKIFIDNDNIGYHYRCTGDSMSRSFPANRINEVKAMLQYFPDVIKDVGTEQTIEEDIFVWASFLIKHVIKGTAKKKDIESLSSFLEDALVSEFLFKSRACKKIPFRYRAMLYLLSWKAYRIAFLYYCMAAAVQQKTKRQHY